MMLRLSIVVALGAAVPASAQGTPPVMPVSPSGSSITPAAVVAPVTAVTPANAYKTVVVCRSDIETGSLVKRHKACLTRKQWQYVNDEHEREARKVVEGGTGRPVGD
jgi:hypothetical protein